MCAKAVKDTGKLVSSFFCSPGLRGACRASEKQHGRGEGRRYRPVIPSIIMGNVRSLPNKVDELAALTRHQRSYRESSLMCLTETWLTELTPDSHINMDGFHLIRADRTKESGKKRGGGLAVFVNDRWCNSRHLTIKETLCSKDIELLAVSMRPYYLPREFSHVIVITVYVPPSANAAAACDVLHATTSRLQTQHPQALFLISGDFNHVSLSSTLPTFTQYVTCHTRNKNTLDLLYANIKEAYSSSPLPPLGGSDHNLMDKVSHPMHEAVAELESSFSDRLLHPKCTKERYRRSFLPAAGKERWDRYGEDEEGDLHSSDAGVRRRGQ